MNDINELTGLDDTELARLLGAARVVVGGAMFLAPRTVMKLWTGEENASPGLNIAAWGLGARDAALGLGLLIALDKKNNGEAVRGWLEAGALSDAGDCLATLASMRRSSKPKALAAAVTAAASAALGMRLASGAED